MKLLLSTTLALFANLCADPVDLRVRVLGPSGPLAHVWMRADFGTSRATPIETDGEGWAVWHLDREVGRRAAVGIAAPPLQAGETNSDYMQRVEAYRARFSGIATPTKTLYDIPENVTTVEQTFTCPQGIQIEFGPVTHADGSFAKLVHFYTPGSGTGSEYNSATGLGRAIGVLKDVTSVAYLQWGEIGLKSRVMRIPIPSSHIDVALGPIQVPTALPRTARITLKRTGIGREWPARAFAGIGQAGVTLVLADGSYITDTVYSTAPVQQNMQKTIDIPPGTYYVLPAMFGPQDFQSTLIDKLVAGVDLSGNVALPHVTVVAGETKDLEYDDVDVINAIYALP